MNTRKKRTFIINFIYYLLIAAIVFFAVRYLLPMLTPFVFGFLIACVMRKPTKFVVRKLKTNHKPVAFFMVLLFYATVGLLIFLLALQSVSWVQALISELPHLYEAKIVPALVKAFESVEGTLLQENPELIESINDLGSDVLKSLGNTVSSVSKWIVTKASGLATAIPGIIIKIVLMVITSFFIAIDYDVLSGFCKKQLSPGSLVLFDQIREYVIGTLFVCIRSYIIIMSLTFVELSIGLSFIRIEHSVLIALLIAIFDILPVLGTGGIMLPWVVVSLLGGDFKKALALFLVYIIITIIRNIVEPKIVGAQLGLHPIVTLVSMSLGLQLLGVVGLFGFPIVLSLLRHLNDNGTIKILK